MMILPVQAKLVNNNYYLELKTKRAYQEFEAAGTTVWQIIITYTNFSHGQGSHKIKINSQLDAG